MTTAPTDDSYLTLSASLSAPFWSRRHTDAVLDKWRLQTNRYVAELVVTELITNAVKASGVEVDAGFGDLFEADEEDVLRSLPRSPEGVIQAVERLSPPKRVPYTKLGVPPMVRLHMSYDRSPRRLLIEVWDQNPEPPKLKHPDPTEEGGRGLLVIGTICERWGWYWPSGIVRDNQPWPQAAQRGGSGEGGRFGKVAWEVVEL